MGTMSTMEQAKGTFDVTIEREPPYDTSDGVTLGRMSITKQFHGELSATSKVDMVAAGTPVPGSAGYVAIERVVGTLQGRPGTFILQHSGSMNRGVPSLTVTVVPDSGTGGCKGLSGTMLIEIVDRQHFYTFDYTIHLDQV